MVGKNSPSATTKSFVVACFAGLAVGALIHTLAYPLRPGLALFDLKFLMIYLGDVFALLGFGVLGYLSARWRKRSMDAAGWMTGLGVSLGGLAGAMLFQSTGQSHAMLFAGLPVALVVMHLPLPALPPFCSKALAGLGLLTFLVFLSGVGKPAPEVKKGFDVAARPQLPALAPKADASGHPDVLMISIDTLRADAILNPDIPTPNLDALRARSMQAPYGHATTPSTLPSHVSMMLGELPLKHGAYTNLGFMPEHGFTTLAEAFQEAGYRTLGTAANGLLHSYTGFDRGFEVLVNVAPHHARAGSPKKVTASGRRMVWYSAGLSDFRSLQLSKMLASRRFPVDDGSVVEDEAIFAETVRDLALGYLGDLYANEKPFFYFLHFMAPHTPYIASREFRGRLSKDFDLPERYRDYGSGTTQFCNQVSADIRNGHPDAAAGVEYLQLLYHEEVMMIDAALGQVFARVEESGRPTIILFTSDHGEHFGENGFMQHGNTVFAPVLEVPFFIAGPNIEAGTFGVIPRLTDIPLTLLHAAGYPAPAFGIGRDLLDPTLEPSPDIAVHEDKAAVYLKGWKLLFEWKAADGASSAIKPFALYRVEEGLEERENLLNDSQYAEIQAEALEVAKGFIASASDRQLREFDEAERMNLSEMGYVFDEEGNAIEEGAY